MKMVVGKDTYKNQKLENAICGLEISEIQTMYFLYIAFYDVMYPIFVDIDDDII